MNVRQVPAATAEMVLYLLAGLLAIFCLGLAASVVGLPLVPLVLPVVVALVLLARRLHRGHGSPALKV
ncbi:hypothetical protein [Streptomyces sp. HUAS ZL42]|uniref:hypothetical protein n=1 Tax=Streptomyces sp. HUAS ZL42 TaxID=3231715 RepID=UPI00345E32F3